MSFDLQQVNLSLAKPTRLKVLARHDNRRRWHWADFGIRLRRSSKGDYPTPPSFICVHVSPILLRVHFYSTEGQRSENVIFMRAFLLAPFGLRCHYSEAYRQRNSHFKMALRSARIDVPNAFRFSNYCRFKVKVRQTDNNHCAHTCGFRDWSSPFGCSDGT